MRVSFYDAGYEAVENANILKQQDAEAFLRGVAAALEATLELTQPDGAYKGFKVSFQITSKSLDSDAVRLANKTV